MEKIMFNDKYSLTKAVINENKTNTRRVIKPQPTGAFVGMNFTKKGKKHKGIIYQRADFDCGTSVDAPYHIGEIVAISQSYKVALTIEETTGLGSGDDASFLKIKGLWYEKSELESGWNNKMFVKANLMPHEIKMASIRVYRLQDISDEDCIKEGIVHIYDLGKFYFENKTKDEGFYFDTPQQAFASLIDKVSGKGTWDKNEWHWVYEFEMKKDLLPTPEEVRIAKQEKEEERIDLGFCPECVTFLDNIEGCKQCMYCGWSACNN